MVKNISLAGLLILVSHTPTIAQPAERLSLKEAIEIALEQNPELVGARRGVDAARGRFWQGVSLPPPTLSIGYDYIPAGSSIAHYSERAIGISQSFDFPTTIALRGSSLSSEIDAAESDTRSVQLSVMMQVKLAYFGVLAKQAKLSLAEENLRVASDFADKSGIRLNAGEGTNLEHLIAKVQRTQAENDVEVARNELRVATSELDLVLGGGHQSGSREYLLTDTLSHQPHTFAIASLVTDAQQSNPLMQSAQSRLNAASTLRSIAWSSILPSFTVSYARQLQGGNPDLYGVSLGVAVPIWFLFDQRGRIQEATAEHARVESELAAKRLAVNLAVKIAYLQFTNDDRQTKLYITDLLPQAEEVFRIASRGYLAGETTYMDLLHAQQTLISVRSAHIDALYNYNASLARLENAVGRELTE